MTRIVYRFFALTIISLILYALLNLLTALQFLPSASPLSGLSFPQISRFAASLLDLAIVGGLLGGGIYVIFMTDSSLSQPTPRLFSFAFWLWVLLVLLTLIAGVFNLLVSWATLLALL